MIRYQFTTDHGFCCSDMLWRVGQWECSSRDSQCSLEKIIVELRCIEYVEQFDPKWAKIFVELFETGTLG